MRAIICDKCGDTCQEELSVTVTFPYGTLGAPAEINLCSARGVKLRRRLKGEPEHEGG